MFSQPFLKDTSRVQQTTQGDILVAVLFLILIYLFFVVSELNVLTTRVVLVTWLVAWQSGGMPVSGRRTFRPALDLLLLGDHLCGKLSATSQPTRPTQPFILSGSIK